MPGVLIIEALAQLGGVLAFESGEHKDSKGHMLFLGIDKAKFRRPVAPGDALDLHVKVLQRRSGVWRLRGEASVEGQRCADAELLVSTVAM